MTEYFSTLKDLLGTVKIRSVSSSYAVLFEEWDTIVGKKFSGKTRLAEVLPKGDKLYLLIHVKSSPLVQELGFFKRNLIAKIKDKYSLDIFDLIIKVAPNNNPERELAKHSEVQEVYDIRPSDEELENIVLPDITVDKIKQSVQNQPTLSQTQKERMFEVIINDLKTQEWMKQKGFPVCKKCGRVMTRKIFGDENLCKFCKNEAEIL